jgi:RimJ/RimL family protein N-acetyltransferase
LLSALRIRPCSALDSARVTAVPELRNDGIVLSAHNDSEVAAHVAGEDEETARRFGWWPAYSTEETVRAAYANWARNWQDDGPVRAFAARDPGSGALVGNCELRIDPDGTGEVSYWTHAGKRGRGYARNSLALLAGYRGLDRHHPPGSARRTRQPRLTRKRTRCRSSRRCCRAQTYR